jgi:hypothetical protein
MLAKWLDYAPGGGNYQVRHRIMSLPHFLTEKRMLMAGGPPYEMISERQILHPHLRGKIRIWYLIRVR